MWMMLAAIGGCTTTTTSPRTDEQASPHEAASTQETDANAPTTITLQFTDATPNLVVSCEDCRDLPSTERFAPDEFPPLAVPLGTEITLKLVAPGFMSKTRKVTLDAKVVAVPATLQPLSG